MADWSESESINYRRLFGVSHEQQSECGETKVCGAIERFSAASSVAGASA